MASDSYRHTAKLLKSLGDSGERHRTSKEFFKELKKDYGSKGYVKQVAQRIKEDSAAIERNAEVDVSRLDLKISYRVES